MTARGVSVCTKCLYRLRGIARMTYCLLRDYLKSELRPDTSLVCEHQPFLHGHVALLLDIDPAHRVVSLTTLRDLIKVIDLAKRGMQWKRKLYGGLFGKIIGSGDGE